MFGVNTAYRSPNPMESSQPSGTFAPKGEISLTDAYPHLRHDGLRRDCGGKYLREARLQRLSAAGRKSGVTAQTMLCPASTVMPKARSAGVAEKTSSPKERSRRWGSL